MRKLLRITTVSGSLDSLLKGQLKFLSRYYEVVGVASGYELLQKVSEREGIRTIDVAMQREISLIKDFHSLLKMIRLIREEKPYIVHTNTPKASLLGMISAWICHVPHRIYTVTGLRFETTTGVFRKILILMERITCACATKVIPEGDGVANTLRRENITKKPLKKILNGNINGLDTSYFDPSLFTQEQKSLLREDLKIKVNDFVYIFVGRLVKDKGINELVNAFRELNNDNTKLLLVGSMEDNLDPLMDSTKKEIEKNKNIISVGFQKDVRPYFALSDALVFPSYREGFPNVVMQAGAMGLPSIVTDINGCNEIIIDKKNGIIIPSKNNIALREAMQYFIDQSNEIREMASQYRDLIISRYEQKTVWEALLEEYRRLEKDI